MYEAGLTFFHQPNEVEAMAFGMNERETVRLALQRILEQFNSLEITHVDTRRFLGMLRVLRAARDICRQTRFHSEGLQLKAKQRQTFRKWHYGEFGQHSPSNMEGGGYEG